MIDQPLRVTDLETPAILIDLDILDRNLRSTAELARKADVNLRPHFKTHKCVWIAQQQLKYGACGITVAKLGEAEVLVDAGIRDILIAFPIVGQIKLHRLARLMDRARVIVSTDNVAVSKELSDLGVSLGRRIPLYVDVNTGLNRCGMEPGKESAELVMVMADLPGIEVRGLMTHGGYAYGQTTYEGLLVAAQQEADGLVQTRKLLEQAGIHVAEISVGSTPTSKFIEQIEGVTEIRPGAYVYGDGVQLSTGIIHRDEIAMSVLTTVVSTPRDGCVIVDAGSKTFSSDINPHCQGYGISRDLPDVYIDRLSEEHGNVSVPAGVNLAIGDQLSFIPNHCCTVSNLHDRLYGVRNGTVVQEIRVDARGKIV